MFIAVSHVGHKLLSLATWSSIRCGPGWPLWALLGRLEIVSPSYAVYRPHRSSRLLGEYADLLLRTAPYKSEYIRRSTGIRSSRLRMYPEEFLRIKLLCPPPEEQRAIVEIVSKESADARRAIDCAHVELSLLEWRIPHPPNRRCGHRKARRARGVGACARGSCTRHCRERRGLERRGRSCRRGGRVTFATVLRFPSMFSAKFFSKLVTVALSAVHRRHWNVRTLSHGARARIIAPPTSSLSARTATRAPTTKIGERNSSDATRRTRVHSRPTLLPY